MLRAEEALDKGVAEASGAKENDDKADLSDNSNLGNDAGLVSLTLIRFAAGPSSMLLNVPDETCFISFGSFI
jgi:hypothetical protein